MFEVDRGCLFKEEFGFDVGKFLLDEGLLDSLEGKLVELF